jgi:predicted transcriptional regulator
VGNLQKRASAAVNRGAAARLNHQGKSEEEIAAILHVTPKTVRVYLHDFLDHDTRFPVEMSQNDVNLLRAQVRSSVEFVIRELTKELLDPNTDAETKVKLADQIGRQYDRLSDLYGLNAPEAGNVVNNNMLMLNGGVSQEDALRDLVAYKAMQLNNAK